MGIDGSGTSCTLARTIRAPADGRYEPGLLNVLDPAALQGEEVVCCIQGHMTLHQELPDGSKQTHELGPGEYAINPRGAWHTADAVEPVVALFITAGKDTTHRPR